MAVDKKIDYVEQDGYNNYIKNSDSVTVPRKFKSRENATPTKLAYITADEAKMLKKMKKNTPHKGPSGVPSYDDFDAQGGFTSGAAMSAAETGSTNAKDRSEVQASNIGAPTGAGPGVKTQRERDLRSSVIAAGAGQKVNPGFFDSTNTVSPYELAMAKAFNPTAFKKNRSSGLGGFLTGGGILGNLFKSIGQKFGLGKTYNQPTYDMGQFNNLGLFSPSINPNNLDIYNEFVDEDEDETLDTTILEGINNIRVPIRKPNTQFIEQLAPNLLDPVEDQVGDINDLMAKLDVFENKEYNTLKIGKELDMNNEEQNQRLKELEEKKNEAMLGSELSPATMFS